MADPIVLFSSIENPNHSGDALYNGGYKSHELWVKLLRQHNVEAYRVTQTGNRLEWLIDHQPIVSRETARRWRKNGGNVRGVTTWINAGFWIDTMQQVYFYDQEMAYTVHNPRLRERMKQLLRIGCHSRTIQAWYMGEFGISPHFIPEWSDTEFWKPDPTRRIPGLIGFMREGDDTDNHIWYIQQHCRAAGLEVSFLQVRGSEREVLEQMQQCDIFLGMNLGKNTFWGEGCPRSPQEAMHAGAVIIAFDVFGNREYLLDGYTGFTVPRARPDLMAAKVVEIMEDETLKEQVRTTGVDFALRYFAPTDQRFKAIQEFLDLC